MFDTLVYTGKENIPSLLLMIDSEKAFDSTAWFFAQKALDLFNFGPDVKRWIRTFYKDASACIFLNGQ